MSGLLGAPSAGCDAPAIGGASAGAADAQLRELVRGLQSAFCSEASSTVALGEVWAWGCNANRQLGDGTKFDRADPVQVSLPPQKFVAIAAPRAADEDGSYALSEGGECWWECWWDEHASIWW